MMHIYPLNLKRKDGQVLTSGSAEPGTEILSGERTGLDMDRRK